MFQQPRIYDSGQSKPALAADLTQVSEFGIATSGEGIIWFPLVQERHPSQAVGEMTFLHQKRRILATCSL